MRVTEEKYEGGESGGLYRGLKMNRSSADIIVAILAIALFSFILIAVFKAL